MNSVNQYIQKLNCFKLWNLLEKRSSYLQNIPKKLPSGNVSNLKDKFKTIISFVSFINLNY
jgi:hypothetical protein